MRVLVITDVHGNIDALEAIDESYDSVLVLGDLVDYGPAPEEAVTWVRERATAVVSGNHDFAMATGADCRSSPVSHDMSVATREFFRPRISADLIAYLKDLPNQRSIEVFGAAAHLVHATPRDPLFEYLAGDADDATWISAVGDLSKSDAWLFVGHTHKPFVKRIGKLTIVNPGSLGMPIDGDPRGCYAIWNDGEIRLKRLRYDVERAVRRLYDSGLDPNVASRMASVLRSAGR